MRTSLSVVAAFSLFACGGSQTPPAPRTVSGAFATIYQTEDGTQTSKPFDTTGAGTAVIAAWVPTASGYDKFPAVMDDAGVSFTIEGVPQGTYYLELDTVSPVSGSTDIFNATFAPFSGSSPDLSSRGPGRPDLSGGTTGAQLNLSLDGLSPWASGDRVLLAGDQIASEFDPLPKGSPAVGATSGVTQLDFFSLPDASKGDVEFIYQRTSSPVGSGATSGSLTAASRFGRLDNLTLTDGSTTSLPLTLAAPPLTGSLNGKLASSKWAALLKQSNPSAVPTAAGQRYGVAAYPGSVAFPNQVESMRQNVAIISSPPLVDVDYGPTAYGQFLGSPWQEVRSYVLNADYQLPQPGTAETCSLPLTVFYSSEELMPAASDPAPTLGPPLSPKIQGLDAFQAQSSVGLTPAISWSPPSLGTPTSYRVDISAYAGRPRYEELTFTVYGATSLQVPPGFLETGSTYLIFITAFQAPWDALGRAPARKGVPWASATTLTAVFAP